jgi:sugar O-acyltransferase (sialic acid O-acetyltransferase NeuD family)
MTDLVIFGVGSYARLAHAYFSRDSPYRPVSFAVDSVHLDATEMLGLPVVSFDQLVDLYPPRRCSMFVAIGYRRVNRGRIEVYERCKRLGYSFVTYVNSSVFQIEPVEIGENTFIFEAVVIQPNAKVGSNCVIWSGCQILHDSVVEDHCFIASHAVLGGYVTVGRSSFVGLNATIRDHVTVAPESVIGAGATIKKDTNEGDVYSVRSSEPHPTKRSPELDEL